MQDNLAEAASHTTLVQTNKHTASFSQVASGLRLPASRWTFTLNHASRLCNRVLSFVHRMISFDRSRRYWTVNLRSIVVQSSALR